MHGDVREPETILGAAALRDTLDLTRPVVLTRNALPHLVPDSREPGEIVRRLLRPLPPGSYLVLTHATADFAPELVARVARVYQGAAEGQLRSREEVLAFFDGLELVPPGLVASRSRRPESEAAAARYTDADCASRMGVARRP